MTFQHSLASLDGLGGKEGVIVVATANDPQSLDPAILRRPGRFDRVVAFPQPSAATRADYLRRLSRDVFDEATVAAAAQATDGFSFAQIRESYIVAAQFSFRAHTEDVTPTDLQAGIALVRGEARATTERYDGQAVGFQGAEARADRMPAASGAARA